MRPAARRAVLGLAPVAAVLAGACGSGARTTAGRDLAVTPSGRQIGRLSTPGTARGEQVAHIKVIASAGRPRAALALVPVYIDAQGPFLFAVDTGATRSLISSRLARELGLPKLGSAGRVAGITGSASAVNVKIGSWSAGPITLPPTQIDAMSGPAEPSGGAEPPTRGPVGLLGSDVLSRFGKIAIDYDRELLIVDPPVR